MLMELYGERCSNDRERNFFGVIITRTFHVCFLFGGKFSVFFFFLNIQEKEVSYEITVKSRYYALVFAVFIEFYWFFWILLGFAAFLPLLCMIS